MPRASGSWYCNTCNTLHGNYLTAELCELGHRVTVICESFKLDLEKITKQTIPPNGKKNKRGKKHRKY